MSKKNNKSVENSYNLAIIIRVSLYHKNFHNFGHNLTTWRILRATTSVVAKSYKIQKITHLTHFDQINTHINGYKIVHKCTSATVTVYICTIIVALLYIILIISNFTPFFSLFSIYKTNASALLHHLLLPLIHTLPQT